MLRLTISLVMTSFLISGSAMAEGNHHGWDEHDGPTTQGNGGMTNDHASDTNEGTTSETTEGPKGQLDKENTDCNNCETTVDLPGKNR